LVKFGKNNACNQIAADYEENINTHEAATEGLKASVEKYDW
jgi:hypothetical protein